MSNPQQERIEKALDKALTDPTTMKDRVIAVVFGLALIGFGVATWVWPECLASQEHTPTGRRGRTYFLILWLLWNRPVGSIAGLLGLTASYGALFRRTKSATRSDGSPTRLV